MEIPSWLHKVKVRGIDSHVGEYRSTKMRLDFDEVFGLGYTPEKGKARHEEFARRFEASPQDETSRDFIYRVGQMYAHLTIREDEKYLKAGFPGKNLLELYIPNPGGAYLYLSIAYRDQSNAETALHIAKSILFKP